MRRRLLTRLLHQLMERAAQCGCCPTDTPVEPTIESPTIDDCCAPPPLGDDPLTVVEHTPWWRDRGLALPTISGLLLGCGLLAQHSSGLAATALFLAGTIAGASTFVPDALRRLARGKLGVALLMTIAAIGAIALAQYAEAAALAFLFSIAEALEARAMSSAQRGLRAMLELIPDRVRVIRAGTTETIAGRDVVDGDVMLVGAGDRLCTDGVVLDGRSFLDTSAITGESIPVSVDVGDAVAAGSVNGSGTLRVTASAPGTDNSLTQIVRLVADAHAHKGNRARLADRIAAPLVPAVLLLSAAVALIGSLASGDPGTWIERALVVLVAASPCAMAISVPVTVISAIGSASKLGIVIKSGQAFEQLGTITRVAFDKTGTLTKNRPSVTRVVTAPEWVPADVLRFAAAVESSSSHPLAAAIRAAAGGALDQDGQPAVHADESPGLGMRGRVGSHDVRVGNARWISLGGSLGVAAEQLASEGMSVVAVEVDAHAVGVIGVRDQLRPEAPETVAALSAMGATVMMLTGDNDRTARAIAAAAGIDDVHADQLPADKARAISDSTAVAPTAMIGDGINDAPALAAATVGIAMGATGSAAAVESADVAFTGTDLRSLPRALTHARRGRRIMTQNIGMALAIIVVLIPLALLGTMPLAGVVLAHELAEVLVIANGLRAARVSRGRNHTDDANDG